MAVAAQSNRAEGRTCASSSRLSTVIRFAVVPLQLVVVFATSVVLAVFVRIFPRPQKHDSPTLAYFFHPDCASGGGGERVLWAAVLGLLRAHRKGDIVIYTDEKNSVARVLRGVSERFGIRLPSGSSKRIRFVPVRFTSIRGPIQLRDRLEGISAAYWRTEGPPSEHCIYFGVTRQFFPEFYAEIFNMRLLNTRIAFTCGSLEPDFIALFRAGQSLGAALVAMTGLVNEKPKHVFVDTVGQAFMFPFVRLACGSSGKIVAYVHYPTMSHDMLERVQSGTAMYNNSATVASSPLLTKAKSFYYRVFLQAYGFAGRFADTVMTNSTWTDTRIKSIWHVPTTVVYPPADLRRGSGEGPRRGSDLRPQLVVSLSQFRREKNQALQLEAFAEVLKRVPTAKFTMMGAVRPNVADDAALVQELKSRAVSLGIDDSVTFKINAPWPDVSAELGRARVAMHTMKDEHFGIALLEFMSAGCVVVANNSGGPRDDIIGTGPNAVGFLADDAEGYAAAIVKVLEGWSTQKITGLRDKAAKKLDSFNNDAEFGDVFAAKLSESAAAH